MTETKDPLYIFLHVPKSGGMTINRHCIRNLQDGGVLWLSPRGMMRFIGEDSHPLYQKAEERISNRLGRSHADTRQWTQQFINALSDTQRRRLKAVVGHHAYLGIHRLFDRKGRYFTFLRDPVERVISHYNYLFTQTEESREIYRIADKSGRPRTLDQWVTEEEVASNFMTRFLARQMSERPSGEIGSFPPVTQDDFTDARKLLDKCFFVGLTERHQDFACIYNILGFSRGIGRQNVTKVKKVTNVEDRIRDLIRVRNTYDEKLYAYAQERMHLDAEIRKRCRRFYLLEQKRALDSTIGGYHKTMRKYLVLLKDKLKTMRV